jgi:putative MATE family efflux protein
MSLSPLNKTVLSIAAPAVVELVLTSMTQLADTIMVGKLGAYAIAAVGLTNQPRFVMLAVFIAFNVGATALVARFRGQENKADAEIVAAQTIMLTLAIGLVATVPGVLLARQMVLFMGAGPDTVDAATIYFSIIMAGFVPTVLPLAVSALLRGVGDTKTSMRYNLTANLVNIVFNYLLIYGKFGFPKLGVAGAAIATVIGNSVACVMAFRALLGKNPRISGSEFIRLRLTRENRTPNPPMLGRITRIGLPSAGEQLAMRVGLLFFTKTVTSLGTLTFAAHQIALTILNLSFVNGQAFGMAAASLTGQALGRGEPDTAKASATACQRAGALISTLMGLGMFAFRDGLVRLFGVEPAVVELGASIMIFAAAIQPLQSSFQIYSGALRGAGDSLYPALSLAIGILGVRPVLSYLLVHSLGMGLVGAWLALSVDQLARFFLIMLRFRRGKWVHIRV